jgi:hypothetical protein
LGIIAVTLVVFACAFGGAMAGIFLGSALPEHHLSVESKNAVQLGMGLVATMSALVLGLLVSSAKTFYDTQSTEMTGMSAKIVVLDRLLAHYGPETRDARHQLRVALAANLDRVWPQERTGTSEQEARPGDDDEVLETIQALSPADDKQRLLQAQAVSMAISIGQNRALMIEQRTGSVSKPMLVVLVLWLAMVFFSIGIFAPRNATVIASFFISALSVSGAILLILEMYTPYRGLIAISSAPLRLALAHLGQ